MKGDTKEFSLQKFLERRIKETKEAGKVRENKEINSRIIYFNWSAMLMEANFVVPLSDRFLIKILSLLERHLMVIIVILIISQHVEFYLTSMGNTLGNTVIKKGCTITIIYGC